MTKRGFALCILAAAAGTACSHDDYDDGGGYCSGNCDTDQNPVAVDDHFMIEEDQAIPFAMLKANDTNVYEITKVVQPPEHGTIEAGEYRPEPGYFGVDQFTYEGKNDYYGNEKAQATVYVLISSDGIPYEHSRLIGNANAYDLAVGDFNGDGKTDLATIESGTNEMSIFLNRSAAEGDYSLEKHVFEGGSNPRRIAAGDLDRDGKVDVVSATSQGVTIFRNISSSGTLAFEGPTTLPFVGASAVALVDLQADGALDVVATSDDYFGSAMDVWINQSTPGAWSFGTGTRFTVPSGAKQVMAVDADGNGEPDLAVLATTKLSLFLNAMTAGAITPAFQTRLDRDTGPTPMSMFLADLDGDAAPELGVLHSYGDMWIYANQGAASPTFEAARVLQLKTSTTLIATAEIDGDNIVDLVGAATGAAPFELLANRSLPQDYSFDSSDALIADVETHRRASFGTPTSLVFVDLDGVPPQEIVVASKGSGSSDPGLRVLYGK